MNLWERLEQRLSLQHLYLKMRMYTRATFRSQTPDQVTEEILDKAERKTLEELKKDHRTDFGRLYHKMKLEFARDEEAEVLPVDERLERLRQGKEDPGLFALYFHYARYLMISCSRKGGLPANLQGIWNGEINPAWDSKFTININLQMNYWPADVCSLSECYEPFFALLERVRESGKKTAKEMYGCRGFVAHHNTDIHADTAPQDQKSCSQSICFGCCRWSPRSTPPSKNHSMNFTAAAMSVI